MYIRSCRILGVNVGASNAEIKKAYRALAKKHHPDVSAESNASERFIQVRKAYNHLSNTDSYQHYINRNNRPRPHVQYAHRPSKRTAGNYQTHSYRTKETVAEAPAFVIKFSAFLDKIYDYLALIIGLVMIFSPPFYFWLDDEKEIAETGWMPIIIPAIIGVLFLTGVFVYMLRFEHPFALEVKGRFMKGMKVFNWK